MKLDTAQRILTALIAWQAVCVWNAAADSQLHLEVNHVEWRGGAHGGYDVFDSGESAQTVSFRVRLVGDPCAFFVGIGSRTPGESQRSAVLGADHLEYSVFESLGTRIPLNDVPVATEAQLIQGTFVSGETMKELSFVVVIPPEQVKAPGRYMDFLRVTVYEGTPRSFSQKDSKTISLAIGVEEVAGLALVEAGSPFNSAAKGQQVDFHELNKGTAKGFDLRIRSNTGYRVYLESENGGVMKNVDGSIATAIPYTLQIGGQSVKLGKGIQPALSRSKRKTESGGDRHEVTITVDETGNALAGTYRDNIVVTVVSLD